MHLPICLQLILVFFASIQIEYATCYAGRPHVGDVDDRLALHLDHELIFVVASEPEAVGTLDCGSKFAFAGFGIDLNRLVGWIEIR